MCHECSSLVHAQCVWSAAQFVITDKHLVASLSDEVQIWLCYRQVNMLFVCTFLYEYEPWLHSVLRCGIDGSLHSGVVSGAVLCHHCVIDTQFWLLALHSGEMYLCARESVSVAVENHSCRQCESISSGISQSAVLIYHGLAAHRRFQSLSIERCLASFCSHHFLIECQYHRSCCRCVGCIIGRDCRDEFRCLVVFHDFLVGEQENLRYSQSVVVACRSHER